MNHTQYKVAALSNSLNYKDNSVLKLAKSFGVQFDQITYQALPLSGFHQSAWLENIFSYDVVYYRGGMRHASDSFMN